MHLTRGGSVQRPLTSGPRGWLADQTPWPVGSTLQPLVGWLHGHALLEAVIRNSKLEVDESRTRWTSGHVTRPADKYPSASGIQDTTLYL
jgi:hypothetical protein